MDEKTLKDYYKIFTTYIQKVRSGRIRPGLLPQPDKRV